MDQGAWASLPKDPSEEDFCLSLRNGLILCNVLNKVNPGAVLKVLFPLSIPLFLTHQKKNRFPNWVSFLLSIQVVENPIIPVQSTEAAAQSAIQYFENMRNFLVAVGAMKLLTFEASDLEKVCSVCNSTFSYCMICTCFCLALLHNAIIAHYCQVFDNLCLPFLFFFWVLSHI